MNLPYNFFSLIIITSFLLNVSEARDQKCDERISFVQGGACGEGRGTKKHPYTSLKQAQSQGKEWDTLIVLSSTTPLDDGIVLLSGQKLIGEENPTGLALSPTQPTITNTTGENGGNGVVVKGDATIENIQFKDTLGDPIHFDEAVNLEVKNVLISGFEMAAIRGVCIKSGSSRIENVIIRNNRVPKNDSVVGIMETLTNGIHRNLYINNVEIAGLASDPNVKFSQSVGIFVKTSDKDSRSTAEIKNVYMHDFSFTPIVGNFGILSAALDESQITMRIDNSTFSHLGDISSAIAGLTQTISSGVLPIAQVRVSIDSCLFEEPQTNKSVNSVVLKNETGIGELELAHSYFKNIGFPAFSNAYGNAQQKITIVKNSSTGSERLFFAAQSFPIRNFDPHVVADVIIKDNVYKGGVDSSAIVIFGGVPWEHLKLTAENNCFTSEGGESSLALGSITNGTDPIGTASIKACHNTFSGFATDIFDSGTSTNYLVQKNWWGPAIKPCASGCAPYQTCQNNLCLGPNNVITTGTGSLDASNPLAQSIRCPDSCCSSNGARKHEQVAEKQSRPAPLPRVKPLLLIPKFSRHNLAERVAL